MGCLMRIELILPRSQHGVQTTTLATPLYGAPGRTRTGTPIRAGDFKSPTATDYVTGAGASGGICTPGFRDLQSRALDYSATDA